MAAVFSGNGLGLFDSSWGRWGIGAGGTAGLGQGGDSQYVNVATGGLLLQGQDEQLVFRGLSVAQLRTYNSQGTVAQAGADGWVTGFERRVTLLSGTFDTAGSVMRVDTGDGGTQDFTWAGPGRYVSSQGAGADDTLTFTAATATWALTEGSTQRQWLFADHADPVQQGRLLQIRDLRSDGTTPAAWNVLYDASNRICEVREADGTTTGDALLFGYDANGRLASLSTREGGLIKGQVFYTYDTLGRLSEVLVDLTPDNTGDNTWSATASANDTHLFRTAYAYDGTSLRIASVTHSDGTVVSYTYDASCRVRTVTRGDTNTNDADGAGQTLTYAYDDASGTTDVTDAAGRTWSYVHDAQGRLTQVLAPAISGLRDVTTYTYDTANRLVQVKSTRGAQVLAQTDYAYDTSGNRTWEWTLVDPALGASAIQRTYDAANQLLTETHYTGLDADGAGSAQSPTGGQTTHFVYDAQSRVRFAIDAAGSVTEYQYATSGNAIGQQVSARHYLGAAYAGATYTLADLVAWATPTQQTNSALTETAYDLWGRISRVTRYANVSATDGSGVLDDSAETVQYVYDAHGLLRSTLTQRSSTATANDGRDVGDATVYAYDGWGRLLSEVSGTVALGSTPLTDPAQLTSRLRTTTWVYLDSAGTLRTTFEGGTANDGNTDNDLLRTQVRDAAGQLVSVTESALTNVTSTRTTHNYYDANGQLRASEDAAGGRTYYFYDAKGALVGQVDETGALIETVFDGVGRATATKAYSVRLDTSSWLVNGVVVPTTYTAPTDPAVRITAYTYDDAGRLLTQTDAAGTVTAYTYDGHGRLVQTTVTDPADPSHPRVTRQLYDGAERLVSTLDAEGYLTEFQYDVANRLVATIRYATATPTAQRASGTLAQLRPATDTLHDQVSRRFYDGRDQLVGELDAEGYLTEYVYDESLHQRAERRYAKQLTGLTGSESFGALRTAAAGGVHETRRSFDALGQLVTEINFEGTVTRYTYDAAGRLTGTVMADATSDMREGHRRYDVFGNLIGELGGEGSTHLVAGMTETQLDALYAQYGTRHSYDALGRRIESIDAQGNKTWYFYDAASRPTFVVRGVAENNAGTTGALNSYAEVTETRYDAFGEVLDTTAYTGRIALATPGDRASVASALTTLAYVSAIDSRRSQTWTARGQLASVTGAEGSLTQYAYDAFGELTRTDSAVGTTAATSTTYTYDRRGLQTGRTEALGATEQRSTNQAYDAFGCVLTATDARGSVTSFGYDRLGRLLTRSQTVQGRTETTTTAYDAYSRTTSVTDAEGATTSYFYNDAARSMTVTTPEGIVATTVHTRTGQTWTVTDGATHTTTYSYDDDGHLKTTQDALGNVATNAYDTRGLLASTTDASGRKVEIHYDAVGRVLSRVVDPADPSNPNDPTKLKLTTAYRYDGQGRQLQVTDPSTHVTQYSFDREGRLTLEVRDPTGLNLRTAYTYDALGRQVTVVHGDGTTAARTVQYTYDGLGRRTAEILDPGTGHLNLTTTYTYDGNDNVIRRTDANGTVTRFYYDEADRLTCSVDTLGAVTRNWYDADGRLVATRSYAQASELVLADTTALSIIDASLVARSEDQGSYRVYDRDGRLRFIIDPAGTVLETTYAADNRATGTRKYATAFTPDATLQGKLLAGTALPADITATRSDALDLQSYAVYDAAGRQRYAIDALGNVEERYYDAAGRQVGSRHYASALTSANLTALKPALQAGTAIPTDVSSRVVADDTHDLRNYQVFDAAGRAVYSVDALGAVQQTFYDAAGRQVGQVAYASAITVDAALLGKLKAGASAADITAKLTTAILNDVRNIEHYQVFDAAGRLTDAIEIVRDAAGNATGLVQQTTWDTADGVTVQASLQTSLTDANVDAHTAELRAGTATPAAVMTWLGTTGGTRYTRSLLDAAGRVHYLLARNGASTLQVTERTYDAMGRLIQETVYANTIPDTAITDAAVQSALTGSASRITRYAYDAAGHLRFQVDDLGGVSERLYDALGRMVEERSYDTRITVTGTLTESAVLAALEAARQSLWSTGFASLPVAGLDTSSVGTSGGSLVLSNGQLVFTPVDLDSANTNANGYPSIWRTQLQSSASNVVFRSEVTTASAVSSAYMLYCVDNALAGADYRRAAAYINGGVLYATSYANGVGTNRAVGTLAPNTTYVIEAQSRAGGTDFFVYVKGTDKANGFRFSITQADKWDSVRMRAYSLTRDGSIGNPLNLDNLSESIAPSRHTSYRYDAAGRLVETTDALGNSESYGYDARGLMTTRTDKLGNVWTYAYDAAGRKTLETSPAVSVAANSYNTTTQSWTTTSTTRAVVTAFTYDALGNVLTKTEDSGQVAARTTTYQYDNRGHQIRTIFPRAWEIDQATGQLVDTLAASEINVTYDALGRAVVQKDVLNNYSYKVYDTEGRAAYDIDQEGYVTGYTYNAFGEQATLTRYANRFDFSKLTSTVDPETGKVWSAGSAIKLGQMATAGALVSDAANDRVLTTAYDLLGQKTSVTQSAITYRKNDGTSATGSPTTTFAYNSYGELVQQSVLVEGSTWAVTTHYYDDLGREILTIDPEGYVTRTAYDAEGDVTEVTEFARAIDTSALDPSMPPALPAAGDAQVGYDRVTRYAYDALGRRASQTLLRHYERSDGSSGVRGVESDFAYDAVDHLTTTTVDGVMVLQTGYDALGRATSTQEAARDVLRSDAESQLLAATSKDLGSVYLYEVASPYTTVAYNAFGNAVKTTRYANGLRNGTATADATRDQVSTTVYDRQGRAVVTQDVYGNTISSQYDAADHVTASWYTLSGSATSRDANVTASYQYDKVGRQTTTTVTRQLTSGGTVFTERADVVVYDGFGDIVQKTATGLTGTLTYTYDKAGNLTSSNETGAVRSFGYNLAGVRNWEQRTVSELNSSNVPTNYSEVWRQVVDLLGRTTESILPSHTSDRTIVNTFVNTVDRWGNVLQQVDPRGFITRFEYNEQNQKTRQIAPLVEVVGTDGMVRWQAPETHWIYDALGRLVATRDANGNVSQTVYNAAGQAIRTVDGTGAVTVTGIDALGNERLSQNPIGYITWQAYDRLGRVTAEGDYLPDANNAARVSTTLQSYVLSETGQRTKVTDALGNATLYDYDSGNNLLHSQTAMGVVKTDTYDVLGNKTSENDGIATQTWQYDIFGHVLDHDDLSAKDYSYTYDAASGQLIGQTSTWGANSTTSYYANGQVRHITESASVWYDYQYDANGNRTVEETATVDGSGLVIRQRTTNTYDSNNRLARVVSEELNSSGAFVRVLLDVRYGYDAVGNRRVVVADSGTGTGVTQPNVSNKLPVVVGTPENRTVKLGTTAVLGLQPGLIFRDPEGKPLTYSATLSNGTALPSWLTFDVSRLADTGHLYFTVDSGAPAGSVAVRLKATDASGGVVTVDFTISTVSNTAPVSTGGATPVFKSVVGQPIALELAAADLFKDSDAGDALTLTLSTVSPAATWLTADASTAGALRLSGTPSAAGTYTLTIVATDGSGAMVSRTVQLTVAANAAPVAVSVGTQNVVIGAQFKIERTLDQLFTDANNDDLTLSATLTGGAPLPSWMSLQVLGDTQPPTIRIVGCAPDMTPGTSYNVVLTAKDPSGATATNTVTISVWKDPGEFILFNPIDDITVQPGAWTYALPSNTFWNRNSLPMTLSVAPGTLPPGVSFNATTGTFSGTATTAGSWTVTVTATISSAQTLSDSFVLNVANIAPVLATYPGIPDQWTHTSKPYSYTIPAGMFTDKNGDTLTYSATGLPSGVTVTGNVISGTPTVAGTYNVTVIVNDGHGGTVNEVYVLNVGNRVPRLQYVIPDQARTGGTAISYTVPAGTFVDDDGDKLTYTATGLPTGVTMSTAGVFSGNVPASGGPYNITVTANDGYGGVVSDTFVLTITPANVAPVFDKNKLPDVYVPYGSSLNVGAAPAFSDPNGDHLTFSLINTTLPAWISWNATTATFTGTNTTSLDGTFSRVITVQASDGKGGVVSGSFTVTYDGSGSRGGNNLMATPSPADTSGKTDKQKTSNGKKNQDPALASGETFMALAAPASSVEQELAVMAVATATAFDQTASGNSQVAWYTYDADNRTLVHEGTLSGGHIVLTAANSYEQRYDAAGNATLQVTGTGNGASYTRSDYTLRGQLFRQWTPQATGTLQSATMLWLQNTYDANGRVLEAKRYFPVGTTYTWTEEYGTITNTYDASGELKEYDDFTYDADGRLLTQVTMGRPVGWFKQEPQPGFVEKNRIDFTTAGSGYDAAGRVKGYTYSQSSAVASQDFTFNYAYTYQGRDGWLELTIGGTSPNTAFKATTSSSTYDAYGRRTSITETTKIDNDTTHDLVNKRYFAYDYNSGILSRRDGYLKNGVWTQADEANGQLANPTPRWITAAQWSAYTSAQRIAVVANSKNLRFAYANGQLIGQTDQAGAKLDATTRLTAYTNSDTGTEGVVVQDGDTLQGIAQKVYGNASLWYVIADANAIDSDDQLVAGVELKVPEVKVSKNDATTFKPYNPGEIIGPTAPGLPYIPPPPSNHCSTLAIIIMVVVAVVVTVFTAGAAAVAMGAALQGSIMATGVAALAGGAGMTLGVAMGAAAIGGFMGSVASQVVGKALGVVDHFSLRQAVSAGIASGLTAGIGYSGVLKSTGSVGRVVGQSKFAQGAVSAVSGNLTSYAANKVAGVDATFSWKSIAVSAVSAGLTSEAMPTIGSKLGINLATKNGQFANDLVGGIVGGTTAMMVRRSFHIGNDRDYGQVLTDAFANTLANALSGEQAYSADQIKMQQLVASDDGTYGSGFDAVNPRDPATMHRDASAGVAWLDTVVVTANRNQAEDGGWKFWSWSQNQNRWVDPISPRSSHQNAYEVLRTQTPWVVKNAVGGDPNVISRHQMNVSLVSDVYASYKSGKPISRADAKLAQLIAESAGYDIGKSGDDGIIGKDSAPALQAFLARAGGVAHSLDGADQNDLANLRVSTGQLTFDAEGNDNPQSRYFSRRLHWPGGASGVTLGRGYDMSGRTSEQVYNDLVAAGVEDDAATRFASGAGLYGNEAREFVDQHQSEFGEISRQSQRVLFEDVTFPAYVNAAEDRYTEAAEAVPGAVEWDRLDYRVRDVAVDLTYQQGRVYQRQMPYILGNNPSQLANYIQATPELLRYEAGRNRIPYLHGP